MIPCQEYSKDFSGNPVPCPHKAFRFIVYLGYTEFVSGRFCARHSVALRRQEARGEIEILQDEPIDEKIPFQGEATASPERNIREFYGL